MKATGVYLPVHVDTADMSAIGQAGGVLLTETARATGLDQVLSWALRPWRKPLAVHDPGQLTSGQGDPGSRDYSLAQWGRAQRSRDAARRIRRLRQLMQAVIDNVSSGVLGTLAEIGKLNGTLKRRSVDILSTVRAD